MKNIFWKNSSVWLKETGYIPGLSYFLCTQKIRKWISNSFGMLTILFMIKKYSFCVVLSELSKILCTFWDIGPGNWVFEGSKSSHLNLYKIKYVY